MKIEANDKEIRDIFSLGYFKIPRFQRPYSWEIDEVESFWDDIISEKNDNYFIGSMVVYQAKRPYFGIVDGQQRLTTITLLLSAIRNGFKKLGEENLARGAHHYVEKPNIDNEDEFILKAETSFPYLQDHIQSYDGFNIDCDAGSEEQKLEKAFKFLTHKINLHVPQLASPENIQKSLFPSDLSSPVNKLKKLRDKVLSLKLVFIQLENEDDAYLIFETLNARGRDLTTSDLIKNLILKKLKTRSVELDQSKEAWNSLVKQFDDIDESNILDTFFLHYWLSRFSYTSDKKLFSEVKNHIGDDEAKAKELIKNLADSAAQYSRGINPKLATWTKEEADIKSALLTLNSFKVKQHSSMMLSLLTAYSSKKITIKNIKWALNKIVAFHYCFNAITSQRSSGSISTNYSRIAIGLSNTKDNNEAQIYLKELSAFLKDKLPDKDEFLIKFNELEYFSNRTKHRPQIVYALSRLMPTNGLPVDFDKLTIEHLVPQSAAKTGAFDDSLIGSIGNLVLVDEKINSDSLKNKEPLEKIRILKNLGFPLQEYLIDPNISEWNADTIQRRAELIADNTFKYISNVVL